MSLPKDHSGQTQRLHSRSTSSAPGAWTPLTIRAALAALLAVLLLAGGPAQAQKKSKDKKDADATDSTPMPPLPDGQVIDFAVGQMLGAWQVGDVELMHKYIAEDVVTVSGNWEPPLIGWSTYLRAYQAQRARSQGGRLERSNTLTKVMGDSAWVTYQWEYVGQVDGSALDAVGHTTLVLQKRAGNWLIVVNHTSTVPLPDRTTAAPAPATTANP